MSKIEKVAKVGIEKESGYTYILGMDGNIYRAPSLSEEEIEEGVEYKFELIMELKLKRERGYIYLIDSEGDVSRSSISRN
jgi:hypothetical protein